MEIPDQLKIPKQVSKLHGFLVPYDGGQQFDLEVQLNNQTSSPMTKDFIGYIGKYDSDAEVFDNLAGFISKDQTIPTGESTAIIPMAAWGIGEYDILAAYGDYQKSSHFPMFVIEDGYLIQDAIYVKYFDIFHRSYANQNVEHKYGVAVPPGEEFYLKLEMKNTTNTDITKDYAFSIGTYDPDEKKLITEAIFVVQDQTVTSGETKTISIPGQSNTTKVYDTLGGYGTYNSSTGEFTYERTTSLVFHSVVIL